MPHARNPFRHNKAHKKNEALTSWAQFADRQAARFVPLAPTPHRMMMSEPQGFRVRLLRVNDLPARQRPHGGKYIFKLGLSFFDLATATFYGATCYSQPDLPVQRSLSEARSSVAASPTQGLDGHPAGFLEGQGSAVDVEASRVDVPFTFDVYFHTRICDPHCVAVVSD
jgi:hypothetical protein